MDYNAGLSKEREMRGSLSLGTFLSTNRTIFIFVAWQDIMDRRLGDINDLDGATTMFRTMYAANQKNELVR